MGSDILLACGRNKRKRLNVIWLRRRFITASKSARAKTENRHYKNRSPTKSRPCMSLETPGGM
jgi:hypothetical protein